MISKARVVIALAVVAIGSALTSAPAQADILYNWFGPHYVAYRPLFPRRTVVAYAPAVAYAPTVAYSPVAAGCNTCAATSVGYAPYTSYRPVSVSVPVTTYRPEVACNACGGTTTVMRPVTMYTQQVQYQPVTAYQPVTSYYNPGCSTCGVQTAAYAAPGCATGNCGVATAGYSVAPSGCSSCGLASAAPAYNAAPMSSFEPTPAYAPAPAAAAPAQAVPMTTPETPTPAIAPQNVVPQTQVEPAAVAPESTSGLNGPSLFRGSAVQQPLPQMRAVPHSHAEESTTAPQARPRLVDPQDKTARAGSANYAVQQAVYSEPVSVRTVKVAPLPKTALQNVPAPRAVSQEEIDAEGWSSAKR